MQEQREHERSDACGVPARKRVGRGDREERADLEIGGVVEYRPGNDVLREQLDR